MAHKDLIVDSDGHFIINPTTRVITNDSDKTAIMQYDHNSERITFEVEPIIEGHNMAKSNRVEIHFVNRSTDKRTINEDVYIVNDLKLENDKLTFTWLISRNATQLAGSLEFVIRFICLDDGNEVYSLNTAIYDGLVVKESINNSSKIIEEQKDLIYQLFENIETDSISIRSVDGDKKFKLTIDDSGTISVNEIINDDVVEVPDIGFE